MAVVLLLKTHFKLGDIPEAFAKTVFLISLRSGRQKKDHWRWLELQQGKALFRGKENTTPLPFTCQKERAGGCETNDWSQGVLFHFCGVLVIGTTPFVKQHKVLRQLMQPLQGRGRQRESAGLEPEIQPHPQAESYVQMDSCQEGCSSLGKLLKSGSRHVGCVC